MTISSRPDMNKSQGVQRGPFKWAADKLSVLLSRVYFPGSAAYWDRRYRAHGSSGKGSYGEEAIFKATFINKFVVDHSIGSVIDFGCGDGAQLSLLEFSDYLGLDVSDTAIRKCRAQFVEDRTKKFLTLSGYSGEQADLVLSLDVVYHLVENDVLNAYLDRLFQAARRFVMIYSTDHQADWPSGSAHVRHRRIGEYCSARFPNFFRMEGINATFGKAPLERKFIIFAKQ